MKSTPKAFTLIELLIVVAIIAILAAIAVPNFLEAQVRSKVARVKADQRTVATGMESYMVDHNRYPPHFAGSYSGNQQIAANDYRILADEALWRLTTPVAYLTSVDLMLDAFNVNTSTVRGPGLPGAGMTWNSDYMFYLGYEYMSMSGGTENFKAWVIRSLGPDNADDAGDWRMYNYAVIPNWPVEWFLMAVYDPTNGTVSGGDIMRFGGNVPAVASQVGIGG